MIRTEYCTCKFHHNTYILTLTVPASASIAASNSPVRVNQSCLSYPARNEPAHCLEPQHDPKWNCASTSTLYPISTHRAGSHHPIHLFDFTVIHIYRLLYFRCFAPCPTSMIPSPPYHECILHNQPNANCRRIASADSRFLLRGIQWLTLILRGKHAALRQPTELLPPIAVGHLHCEDMSLAHLLCDTHKS